MISLTTEQQIRNEWQRKADALAHLVNDDLSTYLTGPANAGSYQQLCDFVRYTQSDWWERSYSDDVCQSLLDALAQYVTNASNALELGEFEQVHLNLNLYWSA